MTTNEILVTIGVVTLIVYTVFNIIYLNDLRKTSLALRRFIAKTEEELHPALLELRRTLEDIRKVSDDISSVAAGLQKAINTIISVERGIKSLYGYYREGLGQTAQSSVAGLRAGVKAGVISLIKNLKDKKEASS